MRPNKVKTAVQCSVCCIYIYIYIYQAVRVVMVTMVGRLEMDTMTRVQILDEVVGNSQSASILEKKWESSYFSSSCR